MNSHGQKKKIVNFFLIDFAISFPSRNLQYQAWIDHVKVHHRRSKNGPGGIRAKSLETLLCRAVFQSSRAGPKQPGYFGRAWLDWKTAVHNNVSKENFALEERQIL